MRIIFGLGVCFLALLFPCFLHADDAQVLDWGIEKYLRYDDTARLLIEINNDREKEETYAIEFKNARESHPSARSSVIVAAKTTKREELAVPGNYLANFPLLEIKRSDGKTIHVSQRPKLEYERLDFKLLIAIYSKEDDYRKIQDFILSSGSIEDQADKSRNIRFIRPRYLPLHWWAYGETDIILIAKPIDSFKSEELNAMEGFARSGGQLITIEPELHDQTFLAKYRAKAQYGTDHVLGKGSLLQLNSIPELGNRFSRYSSIRTYSLRNDLADSSLFSLQCAFGAIYVFPKLWIVLGILGLFLLLVGPLNFVVLHRIRKYEWGWATIPLISLVFAVAIFSLSLARRPSHLNLDEFSYAEMDERGREAATSTQVRISSPIRFPVRLNLPPNTVFSLNSNTLPISSLSDKEAQLCKIGPEPQWGAILWPLAHVEGRFHTFTEYSGSVVRIGPSILRNETGVSFIASIFITPQKLYELGVVRNSEEKIITSVRQGPLSKYYFKDDKGLREKYDRLSMSEEIKEFRSEPFSRALLLNRTMSEESWKEYFKNIRAVFIGLSVSEPTVHIDNPDAVKQHKTITVINYYSMP
jgi:hypothetical protein